MSKLISISIGLMLILTLFAIVIGADFVAVFIETGYEGGTVINGSYTSVLSEEGVETFSIGKLEGAIVIIITVSTIAAVTGIQVLGSGLAEPSVRLILLITAYTGLWSVLSVLAADLIWETPFFGTLIYITITVMFTIGVIQKVSEG